MQITQQSISAVQNSSTQYLHSPRTSHSLSLQHLPTRVQQLLHHKALIRTRGKSCFSSIRLLDITATRIIDLLSSGPTLSFEFFPPADDNGQKKLNTALDALAQLNPSFVSVTCGAGGSSHSRTKNIVVRICKDRPFPAMAHLTCVGHTRSDIATLLDDYASAGVANILALAGDPPGNTATIGDFRYASELVNVIRSHWANFSIGVAAHPEVHPNSTDSISDRRYLMAKLEQADFAVTQFFFDATDYFRLREDMTALGCDRPIIPGVMPVIRPSSIRKYADMNGSTVPESLFRKLESLNKKDRVLAAADEAAKMCRQLLAQGAPGIHLYTLNRSKASQRIIKQLG